VKVEKVIGQIIFSLSPIVALFAMVTMLVLRAGASRVFFDVVGSFQANRLIGDAQAKITVLQSLMLDGLSGITEGVQMLSDQMDKAVDSTVPLAQQIAEARLEFEKFANFQDVNTATTAIVSLGESYAFSGDQALAAGAKMAQLSDIVGGGKATVAATEIGMQFGLIGGMETEDAMKKMISLQQQTGFMYGDLEKANFDRMTSEQKANVVRANSIRMLNQLNTIENRSAATMSQITHVMNQFASSGQLAGDKTSYMAAMSATLIEAGEEQGKAGRALKMMYARLGANTGNNAEVLKRYGIEVKGANGQLRSMEDILHDVSMRYGNLKDADKLALAQAMAGNDHYVRAIKLFENHSRVLRLDTQATKELDTAQSELNKKMEDVSFQLKIQESRLFNAKAAVGNVFTPAVIRATKAQADLNFAFADFAESNKFFASIIDGMFTAQQIGKLYAPIVEAQLNMMSLNVSMRTQQQIARALNNEQLVRAGAYGSQMGMQKMSLDMLDSELSKMSVMTNLSIARIGIENSQQQLMSAQAQMKRALTSEELKEAQLSERNLQTEISQLEADKKRMNVANAILDIKNREVSRNQSNHILNLQERLRQEDNLKLMTVEEMAQKRIDDGHFKRITQIDQVLRNKGMTQKTQNMADEINAKRMEESDARRRVIMQQLIFMKGELAESTQREIFQNDILVADLKEQKMVMAGIIADEGKRILMANALESEIKGQTQGEVILAAAAQRVQQITEMKSNTETQSKAIVQAMTVAARELAQAYGLDEDAIMKMLPKMKIFAQGFSEIEAKQKATVAASMRLQGMLMKTSGVLSGLAMGFSTFGDSERSARASMILMNIAMVPSTIQMLAMTKSSIGLAAGMNGAAVGVNRLSFSLAGLKSALLKTGIGIAVVAIGSLAAWLFAGADEADNAADSMKEFGQAINYTAEQYKEMADAYQGVDSATMASDVATVTSEIAELQKLKAGTDDDSLLKSYTNRIEALKEERAILLDIQNINTATSLVGDTASATEVFDMVKDYQQAGRDAKAAAEANNFLDAPNNFLADRDVYSEMSFGLFDPESAKQKQARLEGVYADAFAAIPQEFQGAIMELAENADTAEDFIADLADFIASDINGIQLDQFGATVQEDIIGPIEAAKEAAFEFANSREEMFFGMAKGNITGDMVKQVVNKGVETLINTTEVIMTNNFNGMTTGQAANEITKQVVRELNARGLNITV